MGSKAVLIIDGQPRTLEVGTSTLGVKLVSVTAREVVVQVGSQRQRIPLGTSGVNVSGSAGDSEAGSTLVLNADVGGHYHANGSINERSVQFLVDTGATLVALSQSEVDRIGLKVNGAQQVMINTANGQSRGFKVQLDSIRIKDVLVYNVQAVVIPSQMPYVLLGNSFLSRFQMRTDNNQLVLTKRP